MRLRDVRIEERRAFVYLLLREYEDDEIVYSESRRTTLREAARLAGAWMLYELPAPGGSGVGPRA